MAELSDAGVPATANRVAAKAFHTQPAPFVAQMSREQESGEPWGSNALHIKEHQK